MRYTPAIEEALVAQITAEPEREVVLPDWAYWKGIDTPWIYRDGMPVPLHYHLYETLIGPLPANASLARRPDVHPRNVNPHLFVVTAERGLRAACPNGHIYTKDDYIPGVGHRCQACRAEKLLGTPSVAQINRAKTTCPRGHALVRRKNGKRRCLECPREQTARWRAKRKGSA